MKLSDNVLILPSYALSQLKLDSLVGMRCKVVDINGANDHIKGCWVELPHEYLGEKEWYIPYESLCL